MRREALDSALSSSARLSQVFLIFFFAIGERIRAPHGFGSRGFGTRVRLSLLAALGPGSKLGHTPSNSTYMRDACFPEGFQFSSLPAGFLLSFSERFYAFLGEEDRSPEMGERELGSPFRIRIDMRVRVRGHGQCAWHPYRLHCAAPPLICCSWSDRQAGG